MNKEELVTYLERIDSALDDKATLHIYGSGACILLGEPDRTSLYLHVAGPYSSVDELNLREAAEAAGMPVNPSDSYQGNHIEWIGPLRLCLEPPSDKNIMVLWQGRKLRIVTVNIPSLIASKLIRYDEIDQGDIRYLLSQGIFNYSEIRDSVSQLPVQFANDQLVQDNLLNLKADMKLWEENA